MRIALVTHNVIRNDGQGRVNYELVRHAAEAGFNVTLYADRVADELLDIPGTEWIPVHPPARRPILVKCLAFEYLANKIVQKRAAEHDLIVANGAVLSIPHHINIAHFVHHTWLHSPYHSSRYLKGIAASYQWLFTFVNTFSERRAFQAARVIVAVSPRVKEELITAGVPEENITVIVNGVDTEEFRPDPTNRRNIGLPTSSVVALFAGDLITPRKNWDTVFRALVSVPDLHLAVAGSLEGSPAPDLAKKLGISDRITFLGFRRDIAAIMRHVDFFVFPSRKDSCPLVLLEALASGLPVITTHAAGLGEVIPPSCGFILPDTEDVEALAQAMTTLTHNAGLRADMAHAARTFALQHTWQAMSQQYLNLFDRLLSRTRSLAIP